MIGCLNGDIEEMAADVCRLTHYDSRCVGSSVIVSMVIHQLIYYGHTMTPYEVVQLGRKYDESIEYYVQRALDSDIASLQLDEKLKRGYTLKAMGLLSGRYGILRISRRGWSPSSMKVEMRTLMAHLLERFLVQDSDMTRYLMNIQRD